MKAMLEHVQGVEWGHDHRLPDEENGLYVLMLRDPRDTFLSHWKLYQRDSPGACTELRFVDLLMKGQMESHQGWNIGWVPYVQQLVEWDRTHPHFSTLVRFERLHENPERVLSEALSRLDLPACYGRLSEAVYQTLGVRCDPSDLPSAWEMGRAGRWRTELQPQTVDALLDYCGPMMDTLGYERL